MALHDSGWLAEELKVPIQYVRQLQKQNPKLLPPSITINNRIQYDDHVVHWWQLKQVDPEIPDFRSWCESICLNQTFRIISYNLPS